MTPLFTAVDTARENGSHIPWTRVPKNDTRVHGPCWSPVYPNTARRHGKSITSLTPVAEVHWVRKTELI